MTQSLPLIGTRVPIKGNPYAGCDPEIDALYEAANKASTVEEQNRLAKEANMRLVELHWVVVGPVTPQFNVAQPLAELMTPPKGGSPACREGRREPRSEASSRRPFTTKR